MLRHVTAASGRCAFFVQGEGVKCAAVRCGRLRAVVEDPDDLRVSLAGVHVTRKRPLRTETMDNKIKPAAAASFAASE